MNIDPSKCPQILGILHDEMLMWSEQEIFDDICVRFILNLPRQELTSLIRIIFQIEQAHWFYQDWITVENTKHKRYPRLKQFSKEIFQHCSLLKSWLSLHDSIFASFTRYKHRVPIRGVIILNQEKSHCVLVSGYKGENYMFPRGKIDKNEADEVCAVREAWEEIGIDLTNEIKQAPSIQLTLNAQDLKLFVICDFHMEIPFNTNTRNEIRDISWVKLSDIVSKKVKTYQVIEFIQQLPQVVKDLQLYNSILPTRQETFDAEDNNILLYLQNILIKEIDEIALDQTNIPNQGLAPYEQFMPQVKSQFGLNTKSQEFKSIFQINS